MKVSLQCIILFVQNVEKLKHFYIDNFTLSLIEETKSEWALLRADTCELALHKSGEDYRQSGESHISRSNNVKIVFDIDEDLIAIHKTLKEKNVVLKEIRTWDNYAYWVLDGEDPEGNVFQLRAKKKD